MQRSVVSFKTSDIVVNVSFCYENTDTSKQTREHLSRIQDFINETRDRVYANYIFALIIETRQLSTKGLNKMWIGSWNDLRDVCDIMDDILYHIQDQFSTSAENFQYFFNYLQETKRLIDANISHCVSVFEERMFM
jgi:adenosylmethionine-8-amino-7-oxononanoate aminotransferase